LLKETRFSERFSSELRFEFFNAWNHAQFAPPNSTLLAGEFGRISGLQVAPREVQFALKLFF
jgi:hypothetical protein